MAAPSAAGPSARSRPPRSAKRAARGRASRSRRRSSPPRRVVRSAGRTSRGVFIASLGRSIHRLGALVIDSRPWEFIRSGHPERPKCALTWEDDVGSFGHKWAEQTMHGVRPLVCVCVFFFAFASVSLL